MLSALYTSPIQVTETMTVRAAAFRQGRQISLPGYAYYVKMNPTLPPLPDVYLNELEYIPNGYARNVKESLWYPVPDKSYEGKALRIRGKTYERGLGFRAPSSVQYVIKPEYKRFVARAGVDEHLLLDRAGGMFLAMHSSVVFRLFIDGVMMAESPVMRITQEPWRFDIEIPKGSRRLNIVCMDAGSRNILDYGNWVDAGFITK